VAIALPGEESKDNLQPNKEDSEMRKGRQLGLDELMIVNPSSQDSGMVFFGDDGTLYQVQGLSEEQPQGLGQFFLGEDGTLYQVQGLDEGEDRESGRFFLGYDGTLYEVVR
jgi:hypothetical protein